MKIGILETGDLDPDLEAIDGPYRDIFAKLLRARRPEADIAAWSVFAGAFPDAPADADLWLVTGSRFGVYEDAPWMRRLAAFLRAAHADGAPILGVCFGHQMVAHALGGAVVKSEKGWGLGLQGYEVAEHAPPIGAPGGALHLHAIHQDQVIAAPPESRIWLSSDFCPIAGLALGPEAAPTVLTIQPHPEFSARLLTGIIRARAGAKIDPALAEQALASVTPDPADGPIRGESVLAALVDRLAPLAEARARLRASAPA